MIPSLLILLALTGCMHLGVGEKSQEFPATATSSVQGDKKSELENRRVYIATEALIAGHPSEEEMVFSYRLTPWYEGRRAACSLTFDDGTVDQYQVAFPLLRERDMRGSFYILTGFRDLGVWKDGMIKRRLFSWEAARKIAAAGNEIGSHGVTHRDLRAIYRTGRGEDVIRELRLSAGHIINRIEQEHLPPGGALTFAWPFWRSTPELAEIASSYYLGARAGCGTFAGYFGCTGGYPPGFESDNYNINSYGVRSRDSLQDISAFLESSLASGRWAVLGFHGFDNGHNGGGAGWDPVGEETFREILSLVGASDFWTAPVGEVLRYIEERRRAAVYIRRASEYGIVLSCEDGLNDSVYSMPLTVDVKIGVGGIVRSILTEVDGEMTFTGLGDGWYRLEMVPDGRSYILLTDNSVRGAPRLSKTRPVK